MAPQSRGGASYAGTRGALGGACQNLGGPGRNIRHLPDTGIGKYPSVKGISRFGAVDRSKGGTNVEGQ